MAIERRIVTVVFADLVGFTALSERLDPEDVASVQDAYFATVRDTIARHGGTLEKFIGDAAMAVFGLTRARDDDAERAVRAGFALTNAVEALGGRIGLESAELRLRVGINTGEVVTAEGGPDRGRVTGDTVNAAARLQTAAPPGRVLVGETTALAVADSVELEAVAPLVLKGKAEPVRASLAVAMRAQRSREEATGGLRARMLGRDAEIAELGRFARRLTEGATEQVLLVAPPGVGKTRLTDEFVAGLGGVRTLRARLRPDTGSPYDGIAQLMRAAVGTVAAQEGAAWIAVRLEAAGVSAARAATMAADAESLFAEPGAAVASADRDALFDAWVSALDASDDRPTLWLIEDVHWAGPDLLAFLAAARTRPRHSGRLVLATTRPSLLERLESDHDWTTVHLEALQAIDAGTLVRALVGDALPPQLVERIVQRSDGNCLFIEELLRTWIAAGTLIRGEVAGTWTLAVTVDDAPLPTSVQQIYAGQLDDLPPSARNAARLASVAGRRFPSAALATLGIRDGPDALAMLDRRALISGPTPAPITGDSYAYRHALLHEAAYASLARAERARSHVALARWLEAAAGNRAAELSDAIASHYEAAVRSVPALASDVADGLSREAASALAGSWLERAADRALAQYANAAAGALYQRAIAMTPASDRLALGPLRIRVGEAAARNGQLDDAITAYASASADLRAVVANRSSTDADRLAARRGLATSAAAESSARYAQIRFADAQAVAEEALQVVGTDDLIAAVPLLLARLYGLEGLTNDYARLHDEAVEVLDLAERAGDPELVFAARRATLMINPEDSELEQWLRSADEGRRLGHWRESTSALINGAGVIADTDPERARALLDDAEQVAEARGLGEPLGWIGQSRAELDLASGDWARSRAVAISTLDLADAHGYLRVQVRTWFVTAFAEVLDDRVLLERAAAWFTSHADAFPHSPYGTIQHSGVVLRLAAAGLMAAPTLDRAEMLAGAAIPDTSPSWLASVERIIQGLIERERIDDAQEMVAVYRAVDVGEVRPLPASSRALASGWVAAAQVRLDEAEERFADAAKAAREAGAPWWRLRSLSGLDSIDRATNEQRAEAAGIARELGISEDRRATIQARGDAP